MSLEKFYVENGNQTDKYDLGYISEFYDPLFSPIQNEVKKVLEIGIYDGDSVILWSDFFKNAEIHCVDIAQRSDLSSHSRIFPVYTNAYDPNFVAKFEKESFDIVIDDGPHTYESMVFFLNHYLSLVKSGGLLILEDIIDRAWTPHLLKIIEGRDDISIEVHDMRLKQKVSHLYERWKNGLDVIVVRKK